MPVPARSLPLLLGLLACGCPVSAMATWSIVACDPDGSCGVAVATHQLAVGASVPAAQARVGALASQFETRPTHGPQGLAALARGQSPTAVLHTLVDTDDGEDGDARDRQIGVVAASGASAAYTGSHAQAADWAGALQGEGFSVQGNGLAGPRVLEAMRARFLATPGALEVRLMAALEAGQAAGGQRIGAMSAALLVRTPQGGWADVDLRVDASRDPVGDLRALLDRRQAHQGMIRAERLLARGDRAGADRAVATALAQSRDWDRIWRRAARLAMQEGERALAVERLSVFQQLNPVWAREELRDPLYAALADEPRVAAWR
ncbi:DUF1028 domain-containing protein [Stenotrophomonas sp. HITSZ_GD]|uniref:DUF1028 domain-containing protein n=1 Tax=Stenotrophomonas sp. HITSZ_GD TaxID=3037248 RepID=UPI00240D934A|nr:DUF1028 domain-containing protein [Stenotrophomonas sp. HITSZ_GD]MDG2526115.1 DUF1028 domain-containing protein [Stenotrophomonas sp. HITSZ_GD]